MKTAILTVTKKAYINSKKLKECFEDTDIYTIKKFADDDAIIIKNGLKEEIKNIFNKYDLLIFIMATGIVTRLIVDSIKAKDSDPAILVMDEENNFVISLLSGHLGGGNEYCKIIANFIGAIPVITTASDVSGKIAVDTISKKINGKIENLESAKKVTALIVNGENVKLKLPQNIILDNENVAGAVIISNRKKIEISQIIPQNIIIGLGCKRGTLKDDILEALKISMEKLNLNFKSIKKIASAWVKKDEEGLIKAGESLGIEIVFFDKEQINAVNIKIEERSEFVKKTIGVYSVSESCAYLASIKKGNFLARKLIYNGITISVYEEEFKYV